ncbi:hypothetical protein WJX81_004080 [Elliptochloris bilobata]|uniref:Ubiquitin-like domain-containing protein n=1 Tax=Elliptochloris bilobata TaxID=381761 RepID=A0AAW1RS34_9CHLO
MAEQTAEASGGPELPTIKLRIKVLTGEEHTVTVASDALVPDIKAKVAEVTGTPVSRQRLIFRGRVLRDASSISEHSIEDGDVLHLVPTTPPQERDLRQPQPQPQDLPGQPPDGLANLGAVIGTVLASLGLQGNINMQNVVLDGPAGDSPPHLLESVAGTLAALYRQPPSERPLPPPSALHALMGMSEARFAAAARAALAGADLPPALHALGGGTTGSSTGQPAVGARRHGMDRQRQRRPLSRELLRLAGLAIARTLDRTAEQLQARSAPALATSASQLLAAVQDDAPDREELAAAAMAAASAAHCAGALLGDVAGLAMALLVAARDEASHMLLGAMRPPAGQALFGAHVFAAPMEEQMQFSPGGVTFAPGMTGLAGLAGAPIMLPGNAAGAATAPLDQAAGQAPSAGQAPPAGGRGGPASGGGSQGGTAGRPGAARTAAFMVPGTQTVVRFLTGDAPLRAMEVTLGNGASATIDLRPVSAALESALSAHPTLRNLFSAPGRPLARAADEAAGGDAAAQPAPAAGAGAPAEQPTPPGGPAVQGATGQRRGAGQPSEPRQAAGPPQEPPVTQSRAKKGPSESGNQTPSAPLSTAAVVASPEGSSGAPQSRREGHAQAPAGQAPADTPAEAPSVKIAFAQDSKNSGAAVASSGGPGRPSGQGGPQEAAPPDLGALFSSLLGGDSGGGGGVAGGGGLEGVLGRMMQSPAMGQLVGQIAGGAGGGRGGGLGGMLSQIAQAPGGQQAGGRGAPAGSDFGALMQQMMPLVSSMLGGGGGGGAHGGQGGGQHGGEGGGLEELAVLPVEHAALWREILEADRAQLQEGAANEPLSDAYLAGWPPSRRSD